MRNVITYFKRETSMLQAVKCSNLQHAGHESLDFRGSLGVYLVTETIAHISKSSSDKQYRVLIRFIKYRVQ